MNFNYGNVSLGELCTQFHPPVFPEFPIHMQTNYLFMISLLFYISQNVCKKSEFFSDKRKLAPKRIEYQLKLDSRSLGINLLFEVLQLNHSFKHEI